MAKFAPLVPAKRRLSKVSTKPIHSWPDTIQLHETAGSSNDLAKELIAKSEPLAPVTLIWVKNQTAGRGRRQNRWQATTGALTFSIILDTKALKLRPETWPLISLASGLAVRRALQQLLPDAPLSVKWPNDVYIANRKICGILIEASPAKLNALILGIGVNVNNPITPTADIATSAISLCELRNDLSVTDVLSAVLDALQAGICELRNSPDSVVCELRTCSYLTGRKVTISTEHDSTTGICRNVNADGALVLQTPTGFSAHVAGTVTLT